MKHQTAVAIASGITAFMLVGGGALVTALRMPTSALTQAAPAESADAPVSAPDATIESFAVQPAALVASTSLSAPAPVAMIPADAASTTDADASLALQAEFAKREADYLKTIAEANQRIEQANANTQMLAKRLVTGNVVYIKAATARYAVSTKRASQIALATATGSKLRKTELVKYNGVVAYEVLLDKGVVYINAKNGAVIHDATAPTTIAANVSSSNSATQPVQQVAAQPPAAQPPVAQPDHNDDPSEDKGDDHGDDHDRGKVDDHSEDHD